MSVDYKDFIKSCTVTGGPRRTNTALDILQVGILHISYFRILLWCQESSLLFLHTNLPRTEGNLNDDLNIPELSVLI